MKKLLILLLLPRIAAGQPLSDSVIQRIDKLFNRFTITTPGCAVAVIKNGAMVFSKGYGMANLEYEIAMSPTTIFHIASESKQYVAFCMLLLEQQGKINLNDDVHKYLDFVPDFGKKISILNLIQHTSGLRDQWQLLANAGWQLDDVITREHVIKIITKQKALNFNPGDEWLYCNTGYTLMAEIIKATTGLTLREYADKYIFKRLGMTNTHFHDDYTEIVKNRADSYMPKGTNGFQKSILNYSNVGPTGLFTTVEDEAKWVMNYEYANVGGKELINRMHETGVLNDGRKLNYAFGLTIDSYKNYKRIGHGGSDAAFRTYAVRYPEQNLGVIVFTNLGSVSANGMCAQVADLFFTAKLIATPPAGEAPDSNFLKRLQGNYYSYRGTLLQFGFDNGKLMSRSPGQSTGGIEWKLVKTGEHRYEATGLTIVFKTMSGTDSIKQFAIENPYSTLEYYRQPPVSQKIVPAEFSGKYYNEETESYYSISSKDNKLILQHRKYADIPLAYIAPDQFTNSNWWINHIRFLRDSKGKVIAFEINSGRVQHLLYKKVK